MGKKEDINAECGQRIEEYRKFLGYSQEYLAEALDISDREYRRIAKGEVVIYASTLGKLAKLGFDEWYLLTGRVSFDQYIDKAVASMPPEMFERDLERLEAIFLKCDQDDIDYSRITKSELEEMSNILKEIVKYGEEHFKEAGEPDGDECGVFTDFLHKHIPERIKRKERNPRIIDNP